MDERIFNITLKETKMVPRSKRSNKAIKEIRSFVTRHMKAKEEDVWIDGKVNEAVWNRGVQKPPLNITVKAVKFEDGLVEVSLPEEEKAGE